MDRVQADESVATSFTRVMNATPSHWGVLSDLVLAAAVAGVVLFAGLLAVGRMAQPEDAMAIVLALAMTPFAVAGGVSLALRFSSRKQVVAWLSGLPFEIVNLNAILAGVGDTLEVVFCESAHVPPRAELQPKLEEVSEDLLIVTERPTERFLAIRLGIIDSKRVPTRTNHARWVRLCLTMEKVLLPLHRERPIERIIVA